MPAKGEHNKWIALILCLIPGFCLAPIFIFPGICGLHRFYEGKIWTGLLWLFTGGLFGIGTIVDAILIVMKPEHY